MKTKSHIFVEIKSKLKPMDFQEIRSLIHTLSRLLLEPTQEPILIYVSEIDYHRIAKACNDHANGNFIGEHTGVPFYYIEIQEENLRIRFLQKPINVIQQAQKLKTNHHERTKNLLQNRS